MDPMPRRRCSRYFPPLLACRGSSVHKLQRGGGAGLRWAVSHCQRRPLYALSLTPIRKHIITRKLSSQHSSGNTDRKGPCPSLTSTCHSITQFSRPQRAFWSSKRFKGNSRDSIDNSINWSKDTTSNDSSSNNHGINRNIARIHSSMDRATYSSRQDCPLRRLTTKNSKRQFFIK